MDDFMISKQIQYAKDNNDTSAISMILNKMRPLIIKYATKMYFMERDDAMQELNIALLEAVIHIKNCEDEASCINYLKMSIIHKYCFLCKQNIKLEQNEDKFSLIPEDKLVYDDLFNATDILFDMKQAILKARGKRKLILKCIIYYQLSDKEISLQLGITRQYINRVRKQFKEQYLQ